MRKLFGGPAEDLCEPPDSFLMRYVHEGAVAEDIHQGVLAGVCPWRYFLRRPKVPPPGHKRQCKEKRDGNCYGNCYQNSSSHARKSRTPGFSETLGSRLQNVKNCPLVEHDESTAFNRSIAVVFQCGGRPR